MGLHFFLTTEYVPPKLALYLESYAYITLLKKVNFNILVTLKKTLVFLYDNSVSKYLYQNVPKIG